MISLTRNWGWMALRGVIAILFGILTVFDPRITLYALVYLFGAYAFADGVLMFVTAIANRQGEPHWRMLVFGGIVGIVAGVLTFAWPGITAVMLLALIAAWVILVGIAEITTAVRLRKVIQGEWMLIVAGVLAVIFGLALVTRPGLGALALVIWIGAYAIVAGVLELALSFRLRSWGHLHPAT